VIVFDEQNRLLAIDRDETPYGRYWVIPGGGIEPEEHPRDAAAREFLEETGLVAELDDEPCMLVTTVHGTQTYFRGRVTGGVFGAGTGPEYQPGSDHIGTHVPTWFTLEDALHINPLCVGLAECLLEHWALSSWPAETIDIVDPEGRPPVRVRAGAIVIAEDRLLLIEFVDEGGDRWYELPGGGVEPGESIEAAVVRELLEETGLAGTIGPQVAEVWMSGRHEHYFLMDVADATLDGGRYDNNGGRPAWLPLDEVAAARLWPVRLRWRLAHWHEHGWPDRPIRLASSEEDLARPCHW
jgi:8-oxo-dGTP diphosphatase